MCGLYKAIVGPVTYGSAGNKTYSLAIYDRIVKTTSVKINATYETGCVSQNVRLNRLDTYQLYGATGVAKFIQPSLNVEHCPENFHNPKMAILNFANPYYDLPVKMKLYDTTIILVCEN